MTREDPENGSTSEDAHADNTDSSPDESAEQSNDTGSSGANGPDKHSVDTVENEDVNLRLQEIDRIFSIVEQALQSDGLDTQQTNQLISVFERAIANPTQTDPETIAEFVSMVEELIIQPSEIEDANITGILSVFEQALAGTNSTQERTEDVLSVVEAAVRDPSSIDPDDVEQFRSGLEGAIVDMTDPYTGPVAQLFGFSGPQEELPEMADGDELKAIRLARLAAAMTQRATGYSAEAGVRTGTRMGYAAMNAGSPAELLTEVRAVTLDELQRAGIDIGEEQSEWLEAHQDALVDERPVTSEQLHQRGERLLSQSAEIGRDEAFHPAYPSILEELAADEARILRLLATEGMQASVDIYDKQYIPFRSTIVARNLSMIGSDSGCRHPERTPIYLQNLDRLGLIRFADEPVANLKRYQVLDAQPHIEAAMENAKRPKTVYGSIQLTEFGIDFCESCLPVEIAHKNQRRRFRGEQPETPSDTAETEERNTTEDS